MVKIQPLMWSEMKGLYNTNALKAYKNTIVNSSQTLLNVGILAVALWLTLAVVDGIVNFGLVTVSEMNFHIDYIFQYVGMTFLLSWLLNPYIVTNLTGAKHLTRAEIEGEPRLRMAINQIEGKVGNTRSPSVVTAVIVTILIGVIVLGMDILTGTNLIASSIADTIAFVLPQTPYVGKTLYEPFRLWYTLVDPNYPYHYLILPAGLTLLAIGNRKPAYYIVEQGYANAFCFGYGIPLISRPRIAVTRGLLNRLETEQIEGVLSHEYAHYKNLDLMVTMIASLVPMIIYSIGHLLLTIAFDFDSYAASRRRDEEEEERNEAIVRFVLLFIGLVLVFVGYIAELGTYAISRSREKLADNFGALISGNPLALADALDRIANSRSPPTNSRMFSWEGNALMPLLYIHVPWETHSAAPTEWLATHPPIQKRIAYLRALALTMSPVTEE